MRTSYIASVVPWLIGVRLIALTSGRNSVLPARTKPVKAMAPKAVIWPGAACSITSAATISPTGATGRFTFRAAFFTGARLGLALATIRFAALAALRTLLRLAEFALRSLARPCTFDPFLRLTMIVPGLVSATQCIDARSPSPGNQTIELSTDRVVSARSSPLHFAQRSPPTAKLPPLHTSIAKWLTTTTKSTHAYRTAAKLTSTWTRPFVTACVRPLRQGLKKHQLVL